MPATDKKAPLVAPRGGGIFRLSTPLAKMQLGDVSPWLLAGLLYLGSGLGLSILIAFRKVIGAAQVEAGCRGPIFYGWVELSYSAVSWGQSC